MGIFDRLFGNDGACPPLDPSSAAAADIEARIGQIEPFVRRVQALVELVPTATAVYAYLGKPPVDFGMAWFVNDSEVSLASLKQDQGLSQGRIQILSKKLGTAYKKSKESARYWTTIAGKRVIVTPSETLAAEIRKAIDEAVS